MIFDNMPKYRGNLSKLIFYLKIAEFPMIAC